MSLKITLEDEAAQTQMSKDDLLELWQVLCAHKLTCVFATPQNNPPQINLLPPCLNEHCSHAAPSSSQSPQRSAY